MRNFMICAFLVIPCSLFAAEIEVRPPQTIQMVDPFGSQTMEGVSLGASDVSTNPRFHIHLSGEIEPGDAEKLESVFFEVAETLPFHGGLLSLDSLGGSFEEGLKLGDFIHGRSLPTVVLQGDSCLSACAIAFSAGAEEAIRGVEKSPSRRVFAEAELGFHAPFIPREVREKRAEEMMTGEDPVADALAFADEMFAVSRELARKINNRSEPWGLRPSLISEFLGYGENEYYQIDSLARAKRSDIQVVTQSVESPQALTWVDAIGACEFRLYADLAEFYDYRTGFTMGPGDRDASRAYPVPFAQSHWSGLETGSIGSDAPMRRSGDRMEIGYFIPGRGNFVCHLQKDAAGWSVDLEGDYHRERAFGGNLKTPGRVPVNAFMLAGASVPRTLEGVDREIRDYVKSRLRKTFPDERARRQGKPVPDMKPSYSCAASLTAAEQLICDIPLLAFLDSLMAETYADARAADDRAKADQSAWFKARGRICQTDQAELDIATARNNQVRCLAGAMITQIERLKNRDF